LKEITWLADRLADVLSKDLMAIPAESYGLVVTGVKARRARIRTRKANKKVGSTIACLFPCFEVMVDMMKISFDLILLIPRPAAISRWSFVFAFQLNAGWLTKRIRLPGEFRENIVLK